MTSLRAKKQVKGKQKREWPVKKPIKNVYKSHVLANIFLLVCSGKQTLRDLAEYLKVSQGSLQFYLKRLMDVDVNLVLRKPRNPARPKSRINPYIYSPNYLEFIMLRIRRGEMEHSGDMKWFSIHHAELFLPAFAKHYFNGKTLFIGDDMNLMDLVEVFNSTVVRYLEKKEQKTKAEEVLEGVITGELLHPETATINLNSIFSTKDENTGEMKQLEVDMEDTFNYVAKKVESGTYVLYKKQINTLQYK